MNVEMMDWIIFHIVIAIMVIVDLKVLEHDDRDPTLKEVFAWTILWILVGVGYGFLILWHYGEEPALLYFTAFLVEKSLSLDNMFVFFAIFTYFGVKYRYQHKVLIVGILSAVLMRAFFIYGGILLLQAFHWMVYIFGAVLVISGVKLAAGVEEEVEPEKNPIVRFAKKVLPITDKYHGSKFFIRENGFKFTPMILVLLAIETTDVIFAVDSVPAVLAITTDFFIAYTSNIMAILGLRALYMLVAQIIYRLEHLSKGLGALLVYLGVKMVLSGFHIKIPVLLSVLIIVTILTVSIVASLLLTRNTLNKEKEEIEVKEVEEAGDN